MTTSNIKLGWSTSHFLMITLSTEINTDENKNEDEDKVKVEAEESGGGGEWGNKLNVLRNLSSNIRGELKI